MKRSANLLRIFYGLLILLALSGCAGAPAPSKDIPDTGLSSLSVVVASDDFEVGRPRVPFVIFDADQPVAEVRAVTITAYDLSGEAGAPQWTGPASNYSDYDIPYWVVYPKLPHPGNWGLKASITQSDGTQTEGDFAIQVLAETASPNLGDIPPAIQNRSLRTEPDLSKLTSDPQPDPKLYQRTVAEALHDHHPAVVTFATPAFCTSRLCGPVVDAVKQVAERSDSGVDFIHIEVYKNFDPLEYADEMEEWHLQSEPWTFVLDSSGRVAARFGGPLSPVELSQALHDLGILS